MIEPRLVVCNGVQVAEDDPRLTGRRLLALDTGGADPNVHLRMEDVTRAFLRRVPDRLTDLLEIAAYVFTADAATRRGAEWEDAAVEPWSRDFRFVLPVRDPVFWSSPHTQDLLAATLTFMSDDKWAFDFCELERRQTIQMYLEFGDRDQWPLHGIERVTMFSGGLDSLAGAVEAGHRGEPLVLVSHRPVAKLSKRQTTLYRRLRDRFGANVLHVPVWMNKEANLGREHTQRTRSFLFAVLGTVVAECIQAKGVRFYENGVVSLNLPVADEVLRARASRTTHPLTLHRLTALLSHVCGRRLIVDNPYLFHTKSDVVRVLADHNAGDLIPFSCSCPHTMFQSRSRWHCGTCSQCIDRRVAMIATGQQEHDPTTDYVSDVFTGPRDEGYERNMAVDFVRHALDLSTMGEDGIAGRFSLELTRAVRHEERRSETAGGLIAMHHRHGKAVMRVVSEQLAASAKCLADGTLDPSCLLALVAGGRHRSPMWTDYAERIAALLQAGVPPACKTYKPKDERHLQELCDGILRANGTVLIREFPFMRWSSSLTKPDWSAEALSLWVELKYVRERRGILQITEDIAADITKYGDNRRRTLFVVYDPKHLITDDKEFSAPMSHRGMLTRFVR